MKNFITISAPSGSGKTTLCKAIQRMKPEIKWSTSYTTRTKRNIEKDGVDYHFISLSKFKHLMRKDYFIEWESVHGFYYGTAKKTLDDAVENCKTLLMELDVKGSMKIMKLFPDKTFSIFIMPPSLEHLRKRLENRGTDSKDRIEIRLKRFTKEIGFKDKFDHVIVNKNLKEAELELIDTLDKKIKGVTDGIKNYTIS
tara:strand:+ start:743 stop:1336 length:594 start_codon:yes stop_codon:yes gene_type:complete